MRAACYVRVSTDEQANEGFSIDAQKRRLMSYADSQDWQVVDFYIDDGYSAKDLNRPNMKRMMDDIEQNKIDVVLVYKLDRMTRSTIDCDQLLRLFERSNVKFQSCTESFETRTATGRMFIRLVADIAQWERETIAERVRFGIEQMVLEGKRPGGVLPYGYDSAGNVVPEEATLIRLIRELYLKGEGYKGIAMRFNREGKLRRDREWSQSTVAYTLENPFYAGIIRLGSKNSEGSYVNFKRDEKVNCLYGEGSHEPIFTKDEYEEHKAFMERKSNNGYSRQKTYWFSGVLRCGRCGSSMFGRLTTKRNRKNGETVRTPYYVCSKKHDGRTCDMPMFRQVHIEHLLMEYIEKTKVEYQELKEESDKLLKATEQRTDEVSDLKKELAKVAERKKKWQYMFVEGMISQEDVRSRILEENNKETELQREIWDKQKLNSGLPKIKELLDLEKLWDVIDDDDKKEVIYTMFNRITVNTPLTNVKGVKNKYFEASLEEVVFN